MLPASPCSAEAAGPAPRTAKHSRVAVGGRVQAPPRARPSRLARSSLRSYRRSREQWLVPSSSAPRHRGAATQSQGTATPEQISVKVSEDRRMQDRNLGRRSDPVGDCKQTCGGCPVSCQLAGTRRASDLTGRRVKTVCWQPTRPAVTHRREPRALPGCAGSSPTRTSQRPAPGQRSRPWHGRA
jgi:hypothetical protein